MEDFPLLLLFFIVYLIAGSSKKKKQSPKKHRSPMRTRAQGEQMDMRALVRDRLTKKGFEAAFEPQKAELQPCEQQRIHLHEITQEQMSKAAEGEDPCHAGGAHDERTGEEFAAYDDDAQQALRQDVLRGVIMSEILTRPCDRMAMRRSGQRRHG